MTQTNTTETEIKTETFKVSLTVTDGMVRVVIDDRTRPVLAKISGVSVIAIYCNDDNLRVFSDYTVREL